MARESVKRADIKALLARKMQKEADLLKTYEIYVPSLDAALVFHRPPDNVLLDTIDEMGDESNTRQVMEAMKHLIYRTCDLLQSPELQKELDVVDPFDTVDAIFDLSDIGIISGELMEMFGMGSMEERVKNSSSATPN